MNSLWLKQLLRRGGEHSLELRQPTGARIFRLSLPWALGLALLALLTQLFIPLMIVGAILLLMKYQFVVVRTGP